MEPNDDTPYPRNPPEQDFSKLPNLPISLDVEKYVRHSKKAPRYDSYDYREEKNSPRWEDDQLFFKWLTDQDIPKELAELLYYHAPEVSFLLGPGHIQGVESIIDINQSGSEVRSGGFFCLATGANGDFIVIRLLGDAAGEVGFLPMGSIWGKDVNQVRELYIPVCHSIGQFLEDSESDKGVPCDYYDAKEMQLGNN